MTKVIGHAFNLSEFVLRPTDMDNVKFAVRTERTHEIGDDVEIKVDDAIRPLVERITVRHPDWMLYGVYCVTRTNRRAYFCSLPQLYIVVDGMKLGAISSNFEEVTCGKDRGKIRTLYTLASEAIDNRRGAITSKDVTRVAKAVDEYIKPNTQLALLRAALEGAADAFRGLGAIPRRAQIRAEAVHQTLHDFLRRAEDDPDKYAALFGTDTETFREFVGAYKPYLDTWHMQQRVKTGNCWAVRMAGEKYYVATGAHLTTGADGDPHPLHLHELPDELKPKVVALRMCEVGQFVPDIGYRPSADTFVAVMD